MEDAYVISESLAKETTTDTIKEVFVIVPPETKVLKLENEIGKETNLNETLIEFAYEEDVENYLLAHELDLAGEDGESIITGRSNAIALKSPGGEIVDIKIEINDKSKSDPQLLNLHKKLVERVMKIKERLEEGKTDKNIRIAASDNIDSNFFKIGGHKHKGQEFRGVKIVFLIKTPKPLREGDKCANR